MGRAPVANRYYVVQLIAASARQYKCLTCIACRARQQDDIVERYSVFTATVKLLCMAIISCVAAGCPVARKKTASREKSALLMKRNDREGQITPIRNIVLRKCHRHRLIESRGHDVSAVCERKRNMYSPKGCYDIPPFEQ